MNKRILCGLMVAALMLFYGGSRAAHASTDTTFYVGARTGSELHTLAAHTYDTGVSVKAGQQLSVMVGESERWSVLTQTSGWRITADGIADTLTTISDDVIGSGTYNLGTLVGYVLSDDGVTNTGYLDIGTAGLDWTATFDGTLHMVCWDTYYANNFHGLNTSISTTPLPGAVWLFVTGLAGLIGYRRKMRA